MLIPATETIEDVDHEDFTWLFNLDFWGGVYGTKAFLPYLKRQPEGHIVNISSVNGFIPSLTGSRERRRMRQQKKSFTEF